MERAARPPLQAKVDDNAKGIFYLCAGLFIFSFQDVIIKQLSADFPVHELVFVRGLVASPLLLVLVHFESGFASLRTDHLALHVIRSILMFCSYLFYYLSIAAIPITTAISLFFTAPLFITAMAVPFLGEKVGHRRWLGVIAGFAGVLIMLRPGLGVFEPAALLALLSAFTYSTAQLLSRRLGMTDPASTMAFYTAMIFTYIGGLMGFFIHVSGFAPSDHPSLDFLLKPWKMPNGLEFAMLLTIGVISAIGIYLLSQAYRIGVANTVAPFEYTSMLWAIILTYLVWSVTPDLYTLAGALVIVGAGIYVLRREGIRRKKPLAAKGPYRSR
ncbi:MAG: DMT family transporter [Hyphomicrobiales bacterium]|nr:DMT family transporter [Hyphomicrobiales bacterium]